MADRRFGVFARSVAPATSHRRVVRESGPCEDGWVYADRKRCGAGEWAKGDPDPRRGDGCCPPNQSCVGLIDMECCPMAWACVDSKAGCLPPG